MLWDFVIKDGVLLNYRCTLLKIRTVEVPDTVKKIAPKAFSMCRGVQNIVLPTSVTEIGSEAFKGCSALESINLPGGLVKIGAEAFRNCSSLKEISIPAGIPEIREFTFCNCTSLKKVDLTDYVERIEAHAFYGCKSLETFKIPERVTVISDFAFCGCSSLKSVIMPEGVQKLGNSSFWGCSLLENITLPSTIKEIEDYAFRDCTNLVDIELPQNIEKIGKNVFIDCRRLELVVPEEHLEFRGSLVGVNLKQKQEIEHDQQSIEDENSKQKKSETIRSFTEVAKPKYYSPGSMLMVRRVHDYDISCTPHAWERVPKQLIENMIDTRNYDADMYLPMKYSIVAAVFLADRQPEAESYIWRNATELISYFINVNDYLTVKRLFESGKFITNSNITTLLECAVDKVQNGGDMKLQVLINNYYLLNATSPRTDISETLTIERREYLNAVKNIESYLSDIRLMIEDGADLSLITGCADDLMGAVSDFRMMLPNELTDIFSSFQR